MLRKLLFSTLAGLALGLVTIGFGGRSASAEVVGNDSFPISAVFDNPCEAGYNPISVQGWYHVVDYTTPAGTLMMRFTAHYTGTDTDGTTYVVNNSRTMEHWAWPSIAPFSDLVVIRLISKGGGDNGRIEITIEYSTVYPAPPSATITRAVCTG